MSPAGESTHDDRALARALEAVATSGAARLGLFLERMEALYGQMDQQYQAVADQYGFHCQGCTESCCRTTFYHHTLVEYLYLRTGLKTLEKDAAAQVLSAARAVASTPGDGRFCPLNEGGRCRLYAHRPMICRLHGIAHEFRRPDGAIHHGPGCAAFDETAGGRPYIAFDRSGFYWELSKIERESREVLGFSGRIKMTVSQMVAAVLGNRPLQGDSSR